MPSQIVWQIPSIFPFARKIAPRPNTNTTIETNHGQISGKPLPFEVHSPGGGEDTSPSAKKRLQIRNGDFNHYAQTVQPPPGMARFAFTDQRVISNPVMGQGATACGSPPNPYQTGMLYVTDPSVQLNGLGGLANGQIQYQNIIDQEDYAAAVDLYQP